MQHFLFLHDTTIHHEPNIASHRASFNEDLEEAGIPSVSFIDIILEVAAQCFTKVCQSLKSSLDRVNRWRAIMVTFNVYRANDRPNSFFVRTAQLLNQLSSFQLLNSVT